MEEKIYDEIAKCHEQIERLKLVKDAINYSYEDVQLIVKTRQFGFNFIKNKLNVDPFIMLKVLDGLIEQEKKQMNLAIDKIINEATEKKLLEEYRNEHKDRK